MPEDDLIVPQTALEDAAQEALKARLWDDLKRNLRQIGIPECGPEGFVRVFRDCLDEIRYARDVAEKASYGRTRVVDGWEMTKNLKTRLDAFLRDLETLKHI